MRDIAIALALCSGLTQPLAAQAQARTAEDLGATIHEACQDLVAFLRVGPAVLPTQEATLRLAKAGPICYTAVRLAGQANGLVQAIDRNADLAPTGTKVIRLPNLRACGAGTATLEDMVHAVVAYGVRHPEALTRPALLFVMEAVAERLPCPQ
jgi:hypothetical protein